MVAVAPLAVSSSSSLSEPPEELLSEATKGAFRATQTFQAQGEAALAVQGEARNAPSRGALPCQRATPPVPRASSQDEGGPFAS